MITYILDRPTYLNARVAYVLVKLTYLKAMIAYILDRPTCLNARAAYVLDRAAYTKAKIAYWEKGQRRNGKRLAGSLRASGLRAARDAIKPKFCNSKICLRLTQNAAHFGQG